MRILVVEDDLELGAIIVAQLRRAGFEADRATTLSDARKAVAAGRYSLMLLDRALPDGDGLALVPDIRRAQPGARVLVLTGQDSVADKIAGLNSGADDYLTKPVELDELMARIRAHLRRAGPDAIEPPITVGALSCDLRAREAFVKGRPLVLHRRELALLEFWRGASAARLRARPCSPRSMKARRSRNPTRSTR